MGTDDPRPTPFDGPCFRQPVRMTLGETLIREGRYFADLLPASAESHAIRAASDFPAGLKPAASPSEWEGAT
jgi:hypothetical protein